MRPWNGGAKSPSWNWSRAEGLNCFEYVDAACVRDTMYTSLQLGLGGNAFTGPLPPALCAALGRIVDGRSASSKKPCDLSGSSYACPLPCAALTAGTCGASCQ